VTLKSSEEEYKKQYLKYFELLRIEQSHVDFLYKENEELKKRLEKCCPDHPLQCPVDVCINKTTGAPIEQCDSLRSPYVCYTTQQHPFQWGCYADITSANSNCKNKVCDTRTCKS